MDQNLTTTIGGRLDRLPFSRTLWYFVLLIALGGVFELYDLFMTAYIAPGLVRSGLFVAKPASFFAANGIGFFVFCTFAGMFVGTMGFGFVADRMGRRAIFTYSLIWYSLASAIMAFQTSAEGIDLWRFIASVGIGLEQVTIDTFIPGAGAAARARPGLRRLPVHRVPDRAGGRLPGLAAGAAQPRSASMAGAGSR